MAAVAENTASTHRAALVKATHQFDIVGYSALKALGRSHSINSGSFDVSGHARLGRLLPLRRPPRPRRRLPREVERRLYEEKTRGPRPGSRRVPGAGGSLREGRRLTIRCAVQDLAEESSSSSLLKSRYCFVAVPPQPGITRNLEELLLTGRRADVTFSVEGSVFHAHKLVLAARSPVFRAMFFGDSRHSDRQRFEVDDMRASVFGVMLRFIYTDEIEMLEKEEGSSKLAMASDLLVAADQYDLERLRLMLWGGIREQGDVGRAVSVLSLVNGQSSCRLLQDRCAGYVARMWEAATVMEEYVELKANCPEALNEVLEQVIISSTTNNHRHLVSSTTTMMEKMSRSTYMSTDVSKGTHQFTILGYSAVQRTHGPGQSIRSGTFDDLGGHDLFIMFYPSGYDNENHDEGELSMSLELSRPFHLRPRPQVQVSGAFRFGDTVSNFYHDFTTDLHDIGPPVIDMDRPKSSRFPGPHDDSLTVRCDFKVMSASTNKKATVVVKQEGEIMVDVVVPPSNISWHFERLLETQLGCDVAFLVDGSDEFFRAHTLVSR
ncbi:hypothetical protein PR202_gb13267 [Eleusine coracana subsp. coracana]|uniref:BTB domain-containing protein n=1 Tax=Eleusine coracana subsp. coracana TaxID=191504 RepID=A0AAV5ETB7_ELECO|nr:hypothetical protein PR202_gb13267 [Eleusine coracana subsp. coracana]